VSRIAVPGLESTIKLECIFIGKLYDEIEKTDQNELRNLRRLAMDKIGEV
jgi:hypothetical protein